VIKKPEPTNVRLTILADDDWTAYLNGETIKGPASWKTITNLEKKLYGDGPWVLGVTAADAGGLAALFAAISINGNLFASTGVHNHLWKATDKELPPNWLDVNFDDSLWVTGSALTHANCLAAEATYNDASPGFMDRLRTAAKSEIHPIWLNNCLDLNKKVCRVINTRFHLELL
jgi:hypothetical protein